MKLSLAKQPMFFRLIDDFIQTIPHYPETVNIAASSHRSLLDSYLSHYSLELPSISHCASYEIWQSRIDDYRIVEYRWHPQKPNGKHIILCHGYFDHAALYGKVIRWALEQGYCLHAFDLPGHGLSSGEPAAIDSFDQYSRVLNTIISRENYPHYLCLGQSTGCAVIINALLDNNIYQQNTNRPENIILFAPLVRSIRWECLRWPYLLLHLFIPHIKRAFIDSSHDKKFNRFLHRKDPLQPTRIPLKWLGAMDAWVKKIKTLTADPQLPCYIIQGTKDKTVDYKYNLPEIERCLPKMQVEFIEGAYHHLANESDFYWRPILRAMDHHLTTL